MEKKSNRFLMAAGILMIISGLWGIISSLIWLNGARELVLHPDRNQSISPVFLPPCGAVKP